MLTHIATYPTGSNVTMMWLTQHPTLIDEQAYEQSGLSLPKSSELKLTFTRTIMGISYEPLFLVVVGEREIPIPNRPDLDPPTAYVPLAESTETDIPAEIIHTAIELKDRYHTRMIVCPAEPDNLATDLRKTEGLTHYESPAIEQLAASRWPTFVSFDHTASIIQRELPSETALSAELNALLKEQITNPITGTPLMGADIKPLPKLVFLDDFPVYRTIQAVRTNQPGPTSALWLALQALGRSRVRPTPEQRDFERELRREVEPASRNRTGY